MEIIGSECDVGYSSGKLAVLFHLPMRALVSGFIPVYFQMPCWSCASKYAFGLSLKEVKMPAV